MMCLNFSPITKLTKTFWSRVEIKKRERTSSLTEVLYNNSEQRQNTWRLCFIVLLIVLALLYLNTIISIETNRFALRGAHRKSRVPLNETVTIRTKVQTTTDSNDLYVNVKSNERWNSTYNLTREDKSHGVDRSEMRMIMDSRYRGIKAGGHFVPECRSRHKVAILVPYRSRESNLVVFLYNIHPFLMKQLLEYRIFVIEQKGSEKFNKGRLFNAGFIELQKYGDWGCVVFHDLDLLPMDQRILYSCPNWPRHMCATVKEKRRRHNFHAIFGGVTAMRLDHYKKVNGYSNMYWGWGGEDNDIFWRIRDSGLPVVRYNKTIAVYMALPHKAQLPNPNRYQMLRTTLERYRDEGLSTVQYTVHSVAFRRLYTHILVDINPIRA